MSLFQNLKKVPPTVTDEITVVVNGVTLKGSPEVVQGMAAKIASAAPDKIPIAPPQAPPKPTLVPEAPKTAEEPEIMNLDTFVALAQAKGMAAAFRQVMSRELEFDPKTVMQKVEAAHQFASRSLMTQFRSGLESEGVDISNPEITRALMEAIDSKHGAELLPSVMAKVVQEGRDAGWIPPLEEKVEAPAEPKKLIASIFPETEGEIESTFQDEDVAALSKQFDQQALAARKEGGEAAEIALLQSLSSEINSGE